MKKLLLALALFSAPLSGAYTIKGGKIINADEVATRVPSGRIGTDEDMAGAAIYLASRAGDYVVGTTIAVDGGIVYANAGIKGDGWD